MLSENGNSKTLVIGARGGIGSALVKKLGNCHTLTSDDLDLNQPQQVSKIDLRNYETVINCAGHSKGTYLGCQKNTYENIAQSLQSLPVMDSNTVDGYQQIPQRVVWPKLGTTQLESYKDTWKCFLQASRSSRTLHILTVHDGKALQALRLVFIGFY